MRFIKMDSLVLLLLSLIPARLLFAQVDARQKLATLFALEREGRTAQAITELEELLNSDSLHPAEAGKAWNILGLAYEEQGDFSHARRAYEHSIQGLEKLPANQRDYAMVLDDLGGLYLAMGDPETAIKLKAKTLRFYKKMSDHAGMAIASSDLAGLALNQKRVGAARKYLQQAQAEMLLTNELDDDNLAAISSMQGWLAYMEGDGALTVTKYQHSLDLWKKRHGEEHRLTGWGYVLLGGAEANLGQLVAALADMQLGLRILERTVGQQNPSYMQAEIAYSRLLDQTEAHAEAARMKTTAERGLKEFYRQQCASCSVSRAALR